jgi:hypothetical protein
MPICCIQFSNAEAAGTTTHNALQGKLEEGSSQMTQAAPTAPSGLLPATLESEQPNKASSPMRQAAQSQQLSATDRMPSTMQENSCLDEASRMLRQAF